jgi:cytochrome b pre-mRNA-processing protein 3
MISFPFRRQTQDPKITRLYGTIVAQARSPSFYADYGVPDTVNGRLDMIILHLVLLLRRTGSGPQALQAVGQEVFNLFCRDIDHNLREMGVGDLSVPKQMRRVGEAYYGRAAAYDAALAAGEGELIEALTRNIFGGPSAGARRLAAYVRKAAAELAAQDRFAAGALHFPDPAAIAAATLESGAGA